MQPKIIDNKTEVSNFTEADVKEVEVPKEPLEEELIAGFDEADDPALLYKDKIDMKFWQQPEFRVLLDVELTKDSKTAFYDLSGLVDKFFDNMLHENFINYKISGTRSNAFDLCKIFYKNNKRFWSSQI